MEQAQPIVRRGFLDVGGRQVHVRTAGVGPPAVFIHSSPTNGSFVLGDLLAQAGVYTGIAFDTPGFGLSDPLPGSRLTVADLADATAAAMVAYGLPAVPVYGTHTGAAIALELAVRHPDRVTGVVLDGLPIFAPDETGTALNGNFQLRADPLGGHFAAVWTRFRDQSIWFPWFDPSPANLLPEPVYAPETVHHWCTMFYDCAEHYLPAYRAAIEYGERAVVAVAALRRPAVFTARTGDMLQPHLDRLPPLRPGQEVRRMGSDRADRLPLTRAAFDRFGSPGPAPAAPAGLGAGAGVRRQFVLVGDRSVLVRHAGEPSGRPTLLLHDLPGAGELAGDRPATGGFVVAPDLPGSGESDPLPAGAPLADYAALLWSVCDALEIRDPVVHGIGFGSSVAVEMAAQRQVFALRLTGLLLPDEAGDPGEAGAVGDTGSAVRADLLARYAPPVQPRPDGGHWYALWAQLRDSLVFWPWYDTRPQAQRAVPVDRDPVRLHHWTAQVMKQHASYHHAIEAVIRHDARARLRDVTCPIEAVSDPAVPLSWAYHAALVTLLESESRTDQATAAHSAAGN